jgi:hypothetical protein
MNSSILVYRPDRSLYASVGEARFNRLVAAGLIARTVPDRKGQIRRAVLFGSPDDPTPPQPGTYQGTRYIYNQKLESGHHCWQHKKVDLKDADGTAINLRGVFLQVVKDCTTL